MDVSQGLAAIKTAIDLTRAARDGAKARELMPDEFAGRVAEIYDYISDAKDALHDAKDKIAELIEEVAKRKRYSFHHSVSWRVEEAQEDGPFCPICIAEGVEMRLMLSNVMDQNGEYLWFHCPKPHGGDGRNRPHSYTVPKDLVPKDRYVVRS